MKHTGLLVSIALLPCLRGAEPPACAHCHREIAERQTKTRMARTWQGVASALLKPDYREEHREGPVLYRAARTTAGGLMFEVTPPGRETVRLPVEAVVGGTRHGVSFLSRLHDIEGAELARAPLVEGRYLHSAHENALLLSPGFPETQPASYETLLGRALSPGFEKKCLTCHAQSAGVHCESCHGSGREHLEAIAAGKPKSAMVSPAKMNAADAMRICAQCHSGFAPVTDPLPDDLLISSQVNALANSECFVQSGGALRCTSCHDPHEDSPLRVTVRSVETCLQCHSAGVARHAGLCPVNRDRGCIGCHMPQAEKGSFTMVDHWIRVEAPGGPTARLPEWKSQVRPRRLFLRILVTNDEAKAAEARQRLERGEEFFDIARQYSSDPSAAGGGYLGAMELDRMDRPLADAVAQLAPGGITPVLHAGSRHIIFQRLPHDFREQADRLQQKASALRVAGRLAEAAEQYTAALRIYPHFLRALLLLGTTIGEQGNAERAAGVLEFAARLYPDDAAVEYNLGIAYGALGRTEEEVRAYRRAIELEPELVSAYQNLGAALLAAGDADGAAGMYRKGLEVNPLSAVLYYNLGVVRRQQHDEQGAEAAIALARKIDPEFVRKQEGSP